MSPSVTATTLDVKPGSLVGSLGALNLFFRALYMESLHMFTRTLSKGMFRCQSGANLRYSAIIRLEGNSCKLVRVGVNNSGLVRRKTTGLGGLSRGVSAAGVGSPSFLVVLATMKDFTCHERSKMCIIPVNYLGS